MPRLRLVFMGSADFAVPVLGALLEAGHEVGGVYAQPPRPAGRGHRERPVPVHAFAAARGLAVRTPVSLKDDGEHRAFAGLGADAAVVAAYGLILPAPILAAPRLGCLNVHASLLPRWRGAAPIQRAILAGDGETGVTIMRMDEGVDTGPIVIAERVPITAQATAAGLGDTLSRLGGRLIVAALDGLSGDGLRPAPQPADGVTHARRLDRDEGRLDWRRPAADLERAVRALNPWPGTWFRHGGERIKVLAAAVVETAAAAAPGRVVDGRLTVACGSGALRLVRLQRGGRAPAEADAFLRGYPVAAGTRLS